MMAVFILITVCFAGLFLLLGLQHYFCVTRRKQKFSKLLEKVFDIFKQFQFLTDLHLPLGLYLSANHDHRVQEVYNKPENLEIAKKVVINMLARGVNKYGKSRVQTFL